MSQALPGIDKRATRLLRARRRTASAGLLAGMTLTAVGVTGLAVVALPATPAGATSDDCSGSLGTAGTYGEWVAGSVTRGIGTVAGPVAYGGSATFGQYSPSIAGPTIATGVAANASSLNLIVGGALTVDGPSTLDNGSGKIAGSEASFSTLTVNGGGTVTNNVGSASLPFSFASVGTALVAASNGWAEASATGTTVASGTTLTLTGTDSTQDIFTVTETQLAAAKNIVINVPSASPQPTVLINVTGTTSYTNPSGQNITYTNGGTAQAATTLWNFNQASSITLSGLTWDGTIVAPFVSKLSASNGAILGSLIIGGSGAGGAFSTSVTPSTNTWDTGTTNGSGLTLFTGGCLPSNSGPAAATPEGSPIDLIGFGALGLGAAAFFMRRRLFPSLSA
jgi:choice-of-anchor A domain-containing protein